MAGVIGQDRRMVSVSQESSDETAQRLRRVIAAAELVMFDGEWSFFEAPLTQPPALTADLLAVVRDEDRWSWLAPGAGTDGERFAVFSVHFPPDVDNSGFVGWLATEFNAGWAPACSSSVVTTASAVASTTTGAARHRSAPRPRRSLLSCAPVGSRPHPVADVSYIGRLLVRHQHQPPSVGC